MRAPRLRFVFPFLCGAIALSGADDPATEDAPAAKIDGTVSISAGGALVDGDRAAFERHSQQGSRGFGGLEELRLRREDGPRTLLLESRLFPGDERYGLHGRWADEGRWHLDFGYDQYRTFYDGSGRVFPGNGAFFPLQEATMHVDRSRAWIEAALFPEGRPHLLLRYEHSTRRGAKPSTELGETNLTGGFGSKAIVPASLLFDETRDLVTADLSRETERERWAAGLRYEHTSYENERRSWRRPQEAPAARASTSRESVETDLFSTHGYYERQWGEHVTASVGGLVSTLDTNLGGYRVFGTDFDVPFDPLFAQRQIGDLGFLGLGGGSQLKQYVLNATAVYRPHRHWQIRPALRYEHLQVDSVSAFIATNIPNSLVTSLQDSAAQTEKHEDRGAETLEVRYTGKPGWTLTARGEWNQGAGNLDEALRDRAAGTSLIDRRTDYRRTAAKYALGAVWYARPGLSLSGQYFYRERRNHYDSPVDSTPEVGPNRYPGYVADHDFATHDFNLRVSWRPSARLSFVTRYDLQRSTVDSRFEGLGETQSARATTHIVSQSATWTPVPRLYLLVSANVAFDQLATPARAFIRNSDNNYSSATVGAGYALTRRSDLLLDASHYQVRDFSDNSTVSLPYGADQRLDDVSLTWVVRLNPHLAYTFRYTYAENSDRASAGHNDYRAHLLYGKVQYTF